MKKIKFLLVTLLTALTLFASAIPSGCYEGSSRHNRDRCAIQISNNVIHVIGSDGYVVAKWTIVSDNNGKLSLKSEYGATTTASWWSEDGKVYLNFNYDTYTLRR
jgi:hypothetical protein